MKIRQNYGILEREFKKIQISKHEKAAAFKQRELTLTQAAAAQRASATVQYFIFKSRGSYSTHLLHLPRN
jgi:hypothetical protein